MSSAAGDIIRICAARGLRIAVAESLTGGLLAADLVSIPGASAVFTGGVVAYDTRLKASLLGVDAALLERAGPVDSEVARQMAYGVRRVCAVGDAVTAAPVLADLGLSTTGVAGPDPDAQTGQPAGVVWIGVSSMRQTSAVELRLSGTREQIRRASVEAALAAARHALEEEPESG